MKFIELTNAEDSCKESINFDLIKKFKLIRDHTMVWFVDDSRPLYANETPEQIKQLLKESSNGKN